MNESLTSNNIIEKIKTVYRDNYQSDNTEAIETVLNDMKDLFNGNKKGFQKCDVKYHDFFHSLQTVPPFVDIIDGWNKSGNTPNVSKEYFDLGIIAVLLHDTGYIKTENDANGTGAKYTFQHIQRSIDFAGQYLRQIGLDTDKILSVQDAIRCTGVGVTVGEVSFNSEEERIISYALGTADLLGQMSAIDYADKLPDLYHEFDEAYQYEGVEKLRNSGVKIINDAEDLLRNTKNFYQQTVLERFEKMGAIYKYVAYHYGEFKNPYVEAIQKNIEKIENSLQTTSLNTVV